MDALQARRAILGGRLAILAAYAVIVGALSFVINAGDAAGGETPAIGRAVLGLWGLGAGLLVWTGRRVGIDGWPALMAWAVIQIPFIAWNTEGSITTQLFDIPLSASSSTTVNGEVTSFSEYGINLVGVVLAGLIASTRDRWERRVAPALHPELTPTLYEIDHRTADGAIHSLGSSGDLAAAERAMASQAARLRSGSERGEIFITERPSGRVVAREELA